MCATRCVLVLRYAKFEVIITFLYKKKIHRSRVHIFENIYIRRRLGMHFWYGKNIVLLYSRKWKMYIFLILLQSNGWQNERKNKIGFFFTGKEIIIFV